MDYKRLYFRLFNTLTDAIEKLDGCAVEEAKAMLIRAQQDAEEMFMEAEE